MVWDPLSVSLESEDPETDEHCSTALLSTLWLSGGIDDDVTTISWQGSCLVVTSLQDLVLNAIARLYRKL